VISAGLLAHINIEQAPTAGHIWRFAGLDPTTEWKKGQKRPFNASLKSLVAFKLGESFVKVQNNDNDVYGKLFAERKKLDQQRNDSGEFADVAKIKSEKVGKSTDAYKAYSQGKLPPAHVHARARRYAVKLFLAHYQLVAYFQHYRVMPVHPYVFDHQPNHVHFVAPPNADVIEGLPDALNVYIDSIRSSR
jgi:hypothetical protein